MSCILIDEIMKVTTKGNHIHLLQHLLQSESFAQTHDLAERWIIKYNSTSPSEKRPRGRPLGSRRKQQLAALGMDIVVYFIVERFRIGISPVHFRGKL